jgi:hypothetical protein
VEEKLYKKMKSVGVSNLVFGIVTIAFGIGAGVMMIVNVARLLAHKSDILFYIIFLPQQSSIPARLINSN